MFTWKCNSTKSLNLNPSLTCLGFYTPPYIMGCLNDKTLTTPPGVLRNIIWKWDDHDMTIMVICWWWFDTAHPGVLRFWGVEEYHMMIMIWWYDDDHLPPRCVVRNSEGSIVSRQARLRAVIWNEYQVTVFVFVFVFYLYLSRSILVFSCTSKYVELVPPGVRLQCICGARQRGRSPVRRPRLCQGQCWGERKRDCDNEMNWDAIKMWLQIRRRLKY